MIKICSPQLGLSPISQLGGEVHDFNLIEALSKRGVMFDVLLPRNRKYKKNRNLNVTYLPFTKIYPPHVFNLVALPYIIKSYKKGFDFLRLHNPYYLGLAGLIIKKLFPSVKIVTAIHLKEERRDLDFIFKKTNFIYEHIFTVSDYLKKWLVKKYKINPSKVSVIYNGVTGLKPQKKDAKLISKYGLKDKTVFLSVGLLNNRKNPLFLVKVFKQLSLRYANLILFFCGSGPLLSKLKEQIKSKKLSKKIYILKPEFGNEKNKIFNLADIFLFPSLEEGFGLVVAEAMMCGKVVVASNNSSLPEIVDDGRNGFLVETNNQKAWINKINILIENPLLLKNMQKNALKKAKRFYNWNLVAEKVLKVLRA